MQRLQASADSQQIWRAGMHRFETGKAQEEATRRIIKGKKEEENKGLLIQSPRSFSEYKDHAWINKGWVGVDKEGWSEGHNAAS